jgi:primosomal protein N' (replication factor Y) (superfamily II helicase)
VFVHADATLPATQALIRWDPVTFAERELAERVELGFPPAVRMAAITGSSAALADFVGSAGLPDRAEILGPVPAEPSRADLNRADLNRADLNRAGPDGAEPDPDPAERALIRTPRPDGLALARALHAAQAARSARKDGGTVRVQLDPAEVA